MLPSEVYDESSLFVFGPDCLLIAQCLVPPPITVPRRGTIGVGEVAEALSSPTEARNFANRISALIKGSTREERVRIEEARDRADCAEAVNSARYGKLDSNIHTYICILLIWTHRAA